MSTQEFIFDRVMIVDDTKIDRYVASYVMKKNQFVKEVLEFDMATKAIEYLEANRNNPEVLPQVILLDICMPEMNGFQFLEKLATLPECVKQSCCIIMLSSSLASKDHELAESNPVVKKFINKPLDKENLQEIKVLYEQALQPAC